MKQFMSKDKRSWIIKIYRIIIKLAHTQVPVSDIQIKGCFWRKHISPPPHTHIIYQLERDTL